MSIFFQMENIQEAYKVQDGEKSRLLHDEKKVLTRIAEATEKHKKGGDYLKSIVYGGLDGIITTFSIVAGVEGASLQATVIIILGFASLLANAISMGLGDALSSMAENKFIVSERSREAWEMENYPEGEIQEMIDIYVEKGYSLEDATNVIRILAKNKEAFIDAMLVDELGLMPVDPKESKFQPWKEGLVTAAAFVICGIVPLAGYVVLIAAFGEKGQWEWITFGVACGLTVVSLFVLGCVKAKFTDENILLSGLMTTLMGVGAAGFAFLLSWGLSHLVGASPGVGAG